MAEVSERKAGKKRMRRDYAAVLRKVETYCSVSCDVLKGIAAEDSSTSIVGHIDVINGQITAYERVLAQIRNGDKS